MPLQAPVFDLDESPRIRETIDQELMPLLITSHGFEQRVKEIVEKLG